MTKCGSCRSGGCGDFSSKAQGLPSLASIDIIERILLQAVKNTAKRAEQASRGELTHDDIVEADLKLVGWLTDTFAGRNPHFATDEGWNPTGLAQYLREAMGEGVRRMFNGSLPEDDCQMIEVGARLFLNNAYVLLEDLGRRGGGASFESLEQYEEVASFVSYWSSLLTGCPFDD